jgi:hypothetical protein
VLQKIGLMVFLSTVKKNTKRVEQPRKPAPGKRSNTGSSLSSTAPVDVFQSSGFQVYKTLLNEVSRKIDQWHAKNTFENQADQKKFFNDDDYVELDRSPTKFESSSGTSSDH